MLFLEAFMPNRCIEREFMSFGFVQSPNVENKCKEDREGKRIRHKIMWFYVIESQIKFCRLYANFFLFSTVAIWCCNCRCHCRFFLSPFILILFKFHFSLDAFPFFLHFCCCCYFISVVCTYSALGVSRPVFISPLLFVFCVSLVLSLLSYTRHSCLCFVVIDSFFRNNCTNVITSVMMWFSKRVMLNYHLQQALL